MGDQDERARRKRMTRRSILAMAAALSFGCSLMNYGLSERDGSDLELILAAITFAAAILATLTLFLSILTETD